jgi:regulator of sigma E protease
MTYLWFQWVYPILLFIAGLGVVVFVHELGHFLAAKAADIKVEKFAMGFGKQLLGFRRGETEYCVNLLPLGGYVKMLGQEDVKAVGEIADPRAFVNKSVGVRLVVVAAGVVMNVVFAAIVFLIVAMIGKSYPAPVIGSVVPGFPAAEAIIEWQDPQGATPSTAATSRPTSKGLRPGDRILEIDSDRFFLRLLGKPVTRFADIAMTAVLAGPDDKFTITLQRETDGRNLLGKTTLGVKQYPDGSQMAFGVSSAMDTVIAEDPELVADPASDFRDGDRLVAINDQAVKHYWDIEAAARTFSGESVQVTVARNGSETRKAIRPLLYTGGEVLWLKDGAALRGSITARDGNDITVLLSDGATRSLPESAIVGGAHQELLDILGLIPRLKVCAIFQGSPADQAGLKPGDIIVGYGDRGAPTLTELLDLNKQYAGKGTNIVVLRGQEKHSAWITPSTKKGTPLIGLRQVADLDHPVVAGVRVGSPAAKAGIDPESILKSVNGAAIGSWIDLFNALKSAAGREVTLTWQTGAAEHQAALGRLAGDAFDANDYEFSLLGPQVAFRLLEVTIVKTNPLDALAWGAGETGKFILSTYLSLQGLAKGSVSTKSLSGPVGIGQLAVQAGRRSLLDFTYFMGVISAILAVMNFLPIPVVDGGHAVFLLIEKARGKPLPPKAVYIAQVCGLVFLGAVFVALTWQDIGRWLGGLW